MHIEITTMPAMRVAAIRHTGPYNQIGPTFGRLASIAGPAGLFQQPGAVAIGVYHDDPRTTPAEQLRSDAGVVVPAGVKVPAGLTEQHVPGGRYAHARHVGPYEGLPQAWELLMDKWLPSSGHAPGDGTSYEIYRNDMSTTPKDQLITDIYVSVA
jgi:AraC family transcriptional regulator